MIASEKTAKKDMRARKGWSELRRRAEDRLVAGGRVTTRGLPEAESRRLLHELEVHQIELELQNEELRAARLEAESGLARYGELFDLAPIGYATLGMDETIQEINHAGAHLLGRARAEILGTKFENYLAPGQIGTLGALLAKARACDARQSYELVLLRSEQPPAHIRSSASFITRGQPTFLLAFEDITQSKRRETALAEAQRALLEANRRKNEFLAALSHELRNPLAPIRTSLHLLSQVEPGGERMRKAQAIMERQVSHLVRLVDDLLDATRITRGRVQLQRERVDLGALVRCGLEDHRAGFDAHGIRFEDRLVSEPLWVDADASRLNQALSNLLSNAQKFTPTGGRVAVSLMREGMKAGLRVHDTGIGMEAEVLEQLFEPFAQAPQTIDRSQGGLGLGLAMAKGLVELHGGTIAVTSEGSGRGTTITVHLPLVEAPTQNPACQEALPDRRRRVLVIEDNEDAADTLSAALDLLGHRVEVAYDGPAGIVRARRFRPEVVICDLGLPSIDGYEVARTLRNDPMLENTVLVALSGYALPEDRNRAFEAGFDQHLTKPASVDAIDRVLREAPTNETPS